MCVTIYNQNSEYHEQFYSNMSKHYMITKNNEPITIEFRQFFNDDELIKIPEDVHCQLFLKIINDNLKISFPICSKKAGKRIDKVNVVMDLTNAPISNYFNSDKRNRATKLLNMAQDYFPDVIGKIYILQPPFIFYA